MVRGLETGREMGNFERERCSIDSPLSGWEVCLFWKTELRVDNSASGRASARGQNGGTGGCFRKARAPGPQC